MNKIIIIINVCLCCCVSEITSQTKIDTLHFVDNDCFDYWLEHKTYPDDKLYCSGRTTTQSCKRLIFNMKDEAFFAWGKNRGKNEIVLMKKSAIFRKKPQFPKRGFRDKTGFCSRAL